MTAFEEGGGGRGASRQRSLGVRFSFYAAAMPLQRQSEDEGQIGPTRIITRPMRMLIGKLRIICPSHVCIRFQEKRYLPAPRPIYVETLSKMAPCLRPLRHDATHPNSPWDQAPPKFASVVLCRCAVGLAPPCARAPHRIAVATAQRCRR